MAVSGRGFFAFAAALAAAGAVSAAEPHWLLTGHSNRPSAVRGVGKEGDAVLIKIDTGSASRLATGSVCYIYRSKALIAQAVVVEAKREASVAKVLSGAEVLSGDEVYIKRQPDL